MDLLPVKSGNEQIPVMYRNPYTPMLDNYVYINTAIAREHNATIFILKQHSYNSYSSSTQDGRIFLYTINMFTGTMTNYGEIPWSNVSPSFIGDMLIDDDYIYLSKGWHYNGNIAPVIIVFKRRDPGPDVPVELERVGSYQFSNDNLECYGRMHWYDENTIAMMSSYRILLFDKTRHVYYEKYRSSSWSCFDFAIGSKLILATRNSTSTPSLIGYRIDDESFFTQTLPTATYGTIAYENGKFYIAHENYLYIYDEATETVIDTINVPWTRPTNINVYRSVVYVSSYESSRVYIYDVKSHSTQTFLLPWTLRAFNGNGIRRGCVMDSWWFLVDETIMITDYSGFSKYNFGYKYESVTVFCNLEFENAFIYDGRFVTFYETYISVHDGDVDYSLEPLSGSSVVKHVNVSKSDYKFLNGTKFK